MARKPRKKYCSDFETTTKIDDCRVWAWASIEIGNLDNYFVNNSIDSFMNHIKKYRGDYYFHNLKFDGQFIVSYLLSNGIKYSDDKEPNTFSCVISAEGQWYMIDITYGYRNNERIHTVIYDSLKKLPFPVKVIAISFDLPILKGEIDYNAERPIGHIITEEEHKYIRNDVEIMARALEIQFSQGLAKMTIGSDAMGSYKKMIGSSNFKRLFPILDLETDSQIRKAYRGGFTWVNPTIQGKVLGEGIVFDVNSLYPSVMYHDLLPIGIPVHFQNKYEYDEDYPLYIQQITCEFELKKGHIPTVQIKGNRFFRGNEYLESSNDERVTLYMTNKDMELFEKHYDIIEPVYSGGLKFKGAKGLFKKYIDYWMEIKENSDGAIRQLAKLMLNNLYGKFASNPNVTGKFPVLDDNGIVKYVLGEETIKEPVYTAMGVFITAGARYKTITTAQQCYDRICYCDTDSIHLTGFTIPDIEVHKSKLGAWKHESSFRRAKFLRQKTYMEEIYMNGKNEGDALNYTHTEWNKKCAGMPENVKESVTLENFNIGFTADGKLMPKRVKGGVILVDTTFSIK